MRTRAAVLRGAGRPWGIEELLLDEPGPGEVRIRFVASGLCHSDEHVRAGHSVVPLPMVGGHEGAGVVEAVGEQVTRVRVGDHVGCSFIPVCGTCRYCATGGHRRQGGPGDHHPGGPHCREAFVRLRAQGTPHGDHS